MKINFKTVEIDGIIYFKKDDVLKLFKKLKITLSKDGGVKK